MKFFISRKTRFGLIIAAIILILLFIYLNRAYAHIYSELGQANLRPSDNIGRYLLGNPAATSTAAATTSPRLLYIALGDSLTAGVGTDKYESSYPYLFAQKLAGSGQNIFLEDFGIPGERTKGLLADLVPLAIRSQPDIITLLIGVNDIHGNIPLATFKKNYASILSRLTKETKAKIYIINIPFIGADTLMLPPYQAYFDYQTIRFNAVISQLAADYRVPLIDLYTPTVNLFKKSGAEYSADLFHPSAAGYKIWAQIIYDSTNH